MAEFWLHGSFAYCQPNAENGRDVAVALKSPPKDFFAAEERWFRIRRAIDTRIEPIIIIAYRLGAAGALSRLFFSGHHARAKHAALFPMPSRKRRCQFFARRAGGRQTFCSRSPAVFSASSYSRNREKCINREKECAERQAKQHGSASRPLPVASVGISPTGPRRLVMAHPDPP